MYISGFAVIGRSNSRDGGVDLIAIKKGDRASPESGPHQFLMAVIKESAE